MNTSKQQYFIKEFCNKWNGRKIDKEIIASSLFKEFSVPILKVNYEKKKIFYKKFKEYRELNNQDLYQIGIILNLIHNKYSFTLNCWSDLFISKYSADLNLFNNLNDKKLKIKRIKGGFIHGDYRLRNILKTRKGIKVVDWEYLGINSIYWDIAILAGDFRHRQFHNELINLDLEYFFKGYGDNLTKEEKDFCMYLGAVDVISDHLYPNRKEKLPIPGNLYKNYCDQEKGFLLCY